MKVGILTYHWIYNFGGQLQAMATAEALKQLGYEPVVINLIQPDVRKEFYERLVSKTQQEAHINFSKNHLPITKECNTEQDLIDVVNEHELKHILVGSDAVFFIKYPHSPLSDTRYPSLFWMSWISKCKNHEDIKIHSISASSMETNFRIMPKDVRQGLRDSLERFSTVTVRDKWTKWFISRVNPNRKVYITPDPVMSFNKNVSKEILDNIKIPIEGKYVLYGLEHQHGEERVEALTKFKKLVNDKGYKLVSLPFPETSYSKFDDETISEPVDVLLWYKLIQNASAVISEKFHPIVVSIHNKVPFYAIDSYGDRISKKFIIPIHMKIQSKTYDLCKRNGLKHVHLPTSKFQIDKIDLMVETLFDKPWDFSKSEPRAEEFSNAVSKLVKNQFD